MFIFIALWAYFTLVGLAFCIFGKSTCTEKTQGIMIGMCDSPKAYNNGIPGKGDLITSRCPSRIDIKYPVYEYTVNGIVYRRASPMGYKARHWSLYLGEQTTVYYDPNCPEKVLSFSKSVWSMYGIAFIFLGIWCIIMWLLLQIA